MFGGARERATKPAIPNVINRLSCATMNQLYHPEKTAEFFDFLKTQKVPTYIVPNNTVSALPSYDAVKIFMGVNGLTGSFLESIAEAYYNTPKDQPPKKPFDFYTAIALCEHIKNPSKLTLDEKTLFYNGEFGITFVSTSQDWNTTREAFASKLDIVPAPADIPFIKMKKENLTKEVALLRMIPSMDSMPVYDVKFTYNPTTFKLSV